MLNTRQTTANTKPAISNKISITATGKITVAVSFIATPSWGVKSVLTRS